LLKNRKEDANLEEKEHCKKRIFGMFFETSYYNNLVGTNIFERE
jgi:hypothetical protein